MPDENEGGQALWDAFSPYQMVRAKRLEGTKVDEGGWNTSAVRVSCGWGEVPVSAWRDENWIDPIEPPGMDEIAKANRSTFYAKVRNSRDCIDFLSFGAPIQVSFEITKQWYHADMGIIEDIPDDVIPHDSHSIQVLDYLSTLDGFVFENTWGPNWGKNGLGLLPRRYFDKWIIDGWMKTKLLNEPDEIPVNGIYSKRIVCPVVDKDYVLNTIIDGSNGNKIGWAFCVPRGGFFDFEELFVKPEYRNRGYGTALAHDMKLIAEREGLPIRMWVSYVDCYKQNHRNVLKIASILGLNITKSEFSWAGYKGIPGKTPKRLPIIRIPARPKGPLDESVTEEEQPREVMTDEMEEEMFVRRARRGRLAQMEEEED